MGDDRIKDLETIRQVFEKYKVPFFVVYGAALGFYRDKDFLPDDDDIDLAVIEKIDLKTRKEIGWALDDLGFKPQPISFNVFGRWEQAESGYNGDEYSGIIVCERGFKFTIFFFEKEMCNTHGMEYVCIPRLGANKLISTPCKFYEKVYQLKIGDKKYKAPYPIEEYLDYSYFNNWKDKTDRRHSPTYPENHEVT